jgi:uncharacterized protein (TIGR04255 family)
MSDSGRKKFLTPPITELVMGISFVPLNELRAQHIGIYWNLIKDRFPVCEQQPPIALDPAAMTFREVPGEIFPLPRFWFSSGPESTLVQLQRDMFLLNWRKGSENLYPHYENVAAQFWEETEILRRFLKENVNDDITIINRCELNYINSIDANALFSSPSDLKNILPAVSGFSDMETAAAKLGALNAAGFYQLSPEVRLEVSLRLGQRTDTGALGSVIEFKAVGAPPTFSLEAARSWYDTAHEMIYESFLRFTTERAQDELWQPT